MRNSNVIKRDESREAMLRDELKDCFETTRWSVVIAAGSGGGEGAESAVADLCQTYWLPLYSFVRRKGNSPEDSEDLTQEFLSRFLRKNYFSLADPKRGRFRTFLLTSLQRFLAEEKRRGERQKRGGGMSVVYIDREAAEAGLAHDLTDDLTPDRIFDQRWAEALLNKAITRLDTDYSCSGRRAVFEKLQSFLWGNEGDRSYAEKGVELGLTESAVKVAVHRLRQRFRQVLRDEVAQTVGSRIELEDELKHLLAVLSGE